MYADSTLGHSPRSQRESSASKAMAVESETISTA